MLDRLTARARAFSRRRSAAAQPTAAGATAAEPAASQPTAAQPAAAATATQPAASEPTAQPAASEPATSLSTDRSLYSMHWNLVLGGHNVGSHCLFDSAWKLANNLFNGEPNHLPCSVFSELLCVHEFEY